MSEFNPPLPPYPYAPPAPPYGAAMPMTIGQILDRVFRLLRANVKPFLAVGLLPIGVLAVFEGVFFGALFFAGVLPHPPPHPDPAAIAWIVVPVYLLFLPVMLLMYGLYYGASTHAALQADEGIRVSTRDAFRDGWSRLGRYTWLLILRSLIISGPILVLVVVIGGGILLATRGGSADSGSLALFLLIPLGILGYIGFFVYAVLMMLRLSLAFTACVHEGIPAGLAVRRSGVLTRGAKGRIFLVALVIYAIGSAAFMAIYAIGMMAFAVGMVAGAGGMDHPSPLMIGLAVVFGLVMLGLVFVWAALQMAAYSNAFAVIYRDQCLRTGGLTPVPAQ